MKRQLEKVLDRYVVVRQTDKLSRDHWLWETFAELRAELEKLDEVVAADAIVRWSVGQGNWARIPWVAIMVPRFTSSVGEGLYCAILFHEDMSGFCLALTQGVSKPMRMKGGVEARHQLRARAVSLREHHAQLSGQGFVLDDHLNLGKSNNAANYAMATIAYKVYARGGEWSEQSLLGDLRVLVQAYASSPGGRFEQAADDGRQSRRCGSRGEAAVERWVSFGTFLPRFLGASYFGPKMLCEIKQIRIAVADLTSCGLSRPDFCLSTLRSSHVTMRRSGRE